MYDLVVIGGGSGGLSVAIAAAKVGAKVALIEKDRLGGEATFAACVPSKGLTQAARLVHRFNSAGQFGLRVRPVKVDFTAVLGRVRAVGEEFARCASAEVLEAKGIEVIHGSAAFEAYDTVQVDGTTRVPGQRFVIATGSRPAVPAIQGLAEAGYLDNHTLWSLTKVPESLIVVGSEPVGLEFAQSFARFGAKVTVLTSSTRILPQDDSEASDLVTQLLTAEGLTIKTGVEVTQVEVRDGQKVCKFQDPASGATGEAAGSEILLASGRLANVEGLNLEAVGLHADAEHGIEVDDYLQTHATRVYAIGDVLQRHPHAHFAECEAAVAFQNAVLRIRKKMDYSGIPWATFLDPEVASVGITHARAEEERRPVRVYRVAFAEIDRARIDGRTEGFAKVVATPTGKVLGATVVGEDASMILQEFVLAMKKGLGLKDISAAVPIYPTYAAVAHHLASQFRESRLGNSYVKSALRLFYGFIPRMVAGNGTAESTPETTSEPEPHALASHEHEH
jgi:pyruvate/2-oxoglutarate dehydrogenase complex dihydrolipoamide dehydrogenase (E3) component